VQDVLHRALRRAGEPRRTNPITSHRGPLRSRTSLNAKLFTADAILFSPAASARSAHRNCSRRCWTTSRNGFSTRCPRTPGSTRATATTPRWAPKSRNSPNGANAAGEREGVVRGSSDSRTLTTPSAMWISTGYRIVWSQQKSCHQARPQQLFRPKRRVSQVALHYSSAIQRSPRQSAAQTGHS